MIEIKLTRLLLKNFKGMTFEFYPDGSDVNIFGCNASGKTTLADAFSWLLFDKDSQGKTDFEIKNLNNNGDAEHNLEHTVEAELSIDGNTVMLKKVYAEKWTKKRGSAHSTFTGHETSYYIDGVPVKANEYRSYIVDHFYDENTVRLLTSPSVFPSMPWQTQRSILLRICGDVTDEQVIGSKPKLAPLAEILTKYKVSKTPLDDLKKVVISKRGSINKELETIPIRIDEVRRALPDITGLNRTTVNHVIAGLEASLDNARLKLQGIDNGGNIAELSKKLAGIDADINKTERAHYNTVMKSVTAINSKINEIRDKERQMERNRKSIIDKINLIKEDMARREKFLEGLRQQWTAIDEEMFNDTTEDTCPACGQALPHERVQEAKNKALAAFNLSKAERLDEINQKGKFLKSGIEQSTQEIIDLEKQLSDITDIDKVDIDALIAERDDLIKKAEDYTLIPEHAVLKEQKASIELEIKAARESVSVDKAAALEEINALQTELREAKINADKLLKREQGESRIEELKAQEKMLSKEFEELEKQLYLIETFIKTKVAMLTDKINGMFEIVRFKLYDVQVNQGISECCVATVNGVPYNTGLNSAAKIQAGLDIIRTLQPHYGLSMPIWIDNRESCTEIPEMKSQIISLYVSPDDTALRVEKIQASKKQAA